MKGVLAHPHEIETSHSNSLFHFWRRAVGPPPTESAGRHGERVRSVKAVQLRTDPRTLSENRHMRRRPVEIWATRTGPHEIQLRKTAAKHRQVIQDRVTM